MCTFCVHCGRCKGEGPELLPEGICPRCETHNDIRAILCSHCGYMLALPAGQSREAINKGAE